MRRFVTEINCCISSIIVLMIYFWLLSFIAFIYWVICSLFKFLLLVNMCRGILDIKACYDIWCLILLLCWDCLIRSSGHLWLVWDICHCLACCIGYLIFWSFLYIAEIESMHFTELELSLQWHWYEAWSHFIHLNNPKQYFLCIIAIAT